MECILAQVKTSCHLCSSLWPRCLCYDLADFRPRRLQIPRFDEQDFARLQPLSKRRRLQRRTLRIQQCADSFFLLSCFFCLFPSICLSTYLPLSISISILLSSYLSILVSISPSLSPCLYLSRSPCRHLSLPPSHPRVHHTSKRPF